MATNIDILSNFILYASEFEQNFVGSHYDRKKLEGIGYVWNSKSLIPLLGYHIFRVRSCYTPAEQIKLKLWFLREQLHTKNVSFP